MEVITLKKFKMKKVNSGVCLLGRFDLRFSKAGQFRFRFYQAVTTRGRHSGLKSRRSRQDPDPEIRIDISDFGIRD